MTASANRLTGRATGSAPVQSPTYPARDLHIFVSALGRLGYNTELLLAATGLRRSDLEDPDARIPCEAFGALIGRAMQERPIKNLGLQLAAETPIGAFPLLDYLVLTSNSVGDGIKHLARPHRPRSTSARMRNRSGSRCGAEMTSCPSNLSCR